MADTKTTLKLSHPINVEGDEVTELKFRRPKLKHLRGIELENMTGDSIIEIVSRLTDIPPSSAEDIDAEDLDKIGGIIEGFFTKSPATGGKRKPR